MKYSNTTTLSKPTFVETLNSELEALPAVERIRRTWEAFEGKVVLSTSFGVQSALMLHLATQAVPEIPIIWVDTGYHFRETYEFAEQLTEKLNLNLKVYNPTITASRAEVLHGKLWEQGVEGLKKYGLIHKVEPMNRALQEHEAKAWITGLRRKQSSTRKDLPVALLQGKTVKIHPVIEWSEKDVYLYLKDNGLPYHPLWEKGYVSIGDWHSTEPLRPGMSEEDTRHGGLKRECGLHEISNMGDYQI